MKKQLCILALLGAFEAIGYAQPIQNAGGNTGYGAASGTGLTNNNANAIVIFTNNGVSLSVNSSGVFTLTNYSAASLGASFNTNGSLLLPNGAFNSPSLAFSATDGFIWPGTTGRIVVQTGSSFLMSLRQATVVYNSADSIGFGNSPDASTSTLDTYYTRASAGTYLFNTNIIARGAVTATNGFTTGNPATFNVDGSGNVTNSGNHQSATVNTTGSAVFAGNVTAGSVGSGFNIVGNGRSYNWRTGGLKMQDVDANTVVFSDDGTGGATHLRDMIFRSLFLGGSATATNGFTSYATDATVALTSTGITNTLGKDGTAYVTATAIAFTIKDRSQATLYTSPTLTATIPVHLQNGWSVNAASGLAGTLIAD